MPLFMSWQCLNNQFPTKICKKNLITKVETFQLNDLSQKLYKMNYANEESEAQE